MPASNRRIRPAAIAKNVKAVAGRLSAQYGDFAHYNRRNPLEELLFIICSIQANEDLYRDTYAALRSAFPRLNLLAEAKEPEIAEAIEFGGLARQKAAKIKRILAQITDCFGRPTLSPLRDMTDAQCESFLTSLWGVGKKTARCVMMYSLGRAVFPVDVHCWRVCRRLGWVRATRPNKSCSPRDMDRLQARIPESLRFSLHVNLISHGRQICRAREPDCDACPIRTFCRQIGVG